MSSIVGRNMARKAINSVSKNETAMKFITDFVHAYLGYIVFVATLALSLIAHLLSITFENMNYSVGANITGAIAGSWLLAIVLCIPIRFLSGLVGNKERFGMVKSFVISYFLSMIIILITRVVF